MKVKVAGFSEKLVLIYKTISRHSLEDFNRTEFYVLRQRCGNSFLSWRQNSRNGSGTTQIYYLASCCHMAIAEKTRLLPCIQTGIAVHILRDKSASNGRERSNCRWR